MFILAWQAPARIAVHLPSARSVRCKRRLRYEFSLLPRNENFRQKSLVDDKDRPVKDDPLA